MTDVLVSLDQQIGGSLEVTFGCYARDPVTRAYRRRTSVLQASDLKRGVADLLGSLAPTEELALQSKVRAGGTPMHIPMIDFAHPSLSVCIAGVKDVFGQPQARDLIFFRSGRSFHAYKPTLLTGEQWRMFMGQLLLMNPKGSAEITDSRWIGHRLVAGYGALRWSCNSGRYLCVPSRVNAPGDREPRRTV